MMLKIIIFVQAVLLAVSIVYALTAKPTTAGQKATDEPKPPYCTIIQTGPDKFGAEWNPGRGVIYVLASESREVAKAWCEGVLGRNKEAEYPRRVVETIQGDKS